MEPKIEVFTKMDFESAREAFYTLKSLAQPVCIVLFGDGGEIRSFVYEELSREIKRVIPVICDSSASWFAAEMFAKGKNSIFKFAPQVGSSGGDLHKVISGIRAANQDGSIVGVCVKAQATNHVSYSTSQGHRLEGSLDCLIIIK